METSLQKWQSLTQDPRVVQFFRGLFERAGVRVTDTGEAFTCVHRGDRIDFEPTLDPATVDYTVDIQSFQVDRLAGQARTGQLDEAEQYRILEALFTPATASTLQHRLLSNPVLVRLMGVESVTHVHFVPPTPEQQEVRHTLVYVDRQWLVVPGLHGRPRRTYRMTVADAVTYQREVMAAVKANRWTTWLKYASWYRQWRKKVSTTP